MTKVLVRWSRPLTLDQLCSWEDDQHDRLYTVFGRHVDYRRRVAPMYTGTTCRMIWDRLTDKSHPVHRFAPRLRVWDLFLRVGLVEPARGRVSDGLVYDVEAALIRGVGPRYNRRNRRNYNGRRLQLLNRTRSGRSVVPALPGYLDTREF